MIRPVNESVNEPVTPRADIILADHCQAHGRSPWFTHALEPMAWSPRLGTHGLELVAWSPWLASYSWEHAHGLVPVALSPWLAGTCSLESMAWNP